MLTSEQKTSVNSNRGLTLIGFRTQGSCILIVSVQFGSFPLHLVYSILACGVALETFPGLQDLGSSGLASSDVCQAHKESVSSTDNKDL